MEKRGDKNDMGSCRVTSQSIANVPHIGATWPCSCGPTNPRMRHHRRTPNRSMPRDRSDQSERIFFSHACRGTINAARDANGMHACGTAASTFPTPCPAANATNIALLSLPATLLPDSGPTAHASSTGTLTTPAALAAARAAQLAPAVPTAVVRLRRPPALLRRVLGRGHVRRVGLARTALRRRRVRHERERENDCAVAGMM